MYSVGLELRVGDFPGVFEVEILVGASFPAEFFYERIDKRS
jgi:hypothetical protein